MSFPWDGRYAVILRGWASPAKFQPCAQEAFDDLAEAQALDRFDSVQLVSEEDYSLIPEPGEARTLIHTPDSRKYDGVVYRLALKPETSRTFLQGAGG
jgi:hypothetical protein